MATSGGTWVPRVLIIFIFLAGLYLWTSPSGTSNSLKGRSSASSSSAEGRRATADAAAASATASAAAAGRQRKSGGPSRAVRMFIVRENADVVEVMLLPAWQGVDQGDAAKDHPMDVLGGARNFMESPSRAAHRILKARLGLRPRDVQFLENVLEGPQYEWADMHTYVALVLPRTSDVAVRHLKKNGADGHFEPISTLAKQYAPARFARGMLDDLPYAFKWLYPYLLTAGKSPQKCMGQPPDWGPEAIRKAKMMWPAQRRKDGTVYHPE